MFTLNYKHRLSHQQNAFAEEKGWTQAWLGNMPSFPQPHGWSRPLFLLKGYSCKEYNSPEYIAWVLYILWSLNLAVKLYRATSVSSCNRLFPYTWQGTGTVPGTTRAPRKNWNGGYGLRLNHLHFFLRILCSPEESTVKWAQALRTHAGEFNKLLDRRCLEYK